MIIIEGVDGSGKTTLVEELKERGVITDSYLSPAKTTIAQGLNSKAFIDECDLYLDKYSQNNRVAVDRFFYSELIYAPVMGRELHFPRAVCQNFHRRIMSSRSVIVLCEPPLEAIVQGAQVEEQMEGVHDNLHRIALAYRALFSILPNNKVFVHDWLNPFSIEFIVDMINSKQGE